MAARAPTPYPSPPLNLTSSVEDDEISFLRLDDAFACDEPVTQWPSNASTASLTDAGFGERLQRVVARSRTAGPGRGTVGRAFLVLKRKVTDALRGLRM